MKIFLNVDIYLIYKVFIAFPWIPHLCQIMKSTSALKYSFADFVSTDTFGLFSFNFYRMVRKKLLAYSLSQKKMSLLIIDEL